MITPAQIRWAAVAAIFSSTAAVAQSPTPTPSIDSVPEKIAPGAKPTEPSKNLSEKLDQSNGVIKPKEVDPGIEKPAPSAADPKLVKPPGAQGGSQAPEAK